MFWKISAAFTFFKLLLPLLAVFLLMKYVIFGTFFRSDPSVHPPVPLIKMVIDAAPLLVELAETPAQIERGLSKRKSLPKDQGMLFVFKQPGLYPFWMKDMYFPIDIIWIGADKKVVGFSENLAPESYPETFAPPLPVQYVLEVDAGWVKEHGILVGDILSTPKDL